MSTFHQLSAGKSGSRPGSGPPSAAFIPAAEQVNPSIATANAAGQNKPGVDFQAVAVNSSGIDAKSSTITALLQLFPKATDLFRSCRFLSFGLISGLTEWDDGHPATFAELFLELGREALG